LGLRLGDNEAAAAVEITGVLLLDILVNVNDDVDEEEVEADPEAVLALAADTEVEAGDRGNLFLDTILGVLLLLPVAEDEVGEHI